MSQISRPDLPKEFDPQDPKLKKKFNEYADEKNYIRKTEKRVYLACGASSNSGKCKLPAGFGTDHTGYGRCKFHGGCNTGPKTKKGKKKAAQNSRKHGFYSDSLHDKEKEAYKELKEKSAQIISLEEEILMLKAKIKVYLEKWRDKWKDFYSQRLEEDSKAVECTSCGKTYTIGMEKTKNYCKLCENEEFRTVETGIKATEQDAVNYADYKTRVKFNKKPNGGYEYYHAGSIEDNALDRALNTLSRLIAKHAKLTEDTESGLVGKINSELRAASRGKVEVSWSGDAQHKKEAAKGAVRRE